MSSGKQKNLSCRIPDSRRQRRDVLLLAAVSVGYLAQNQHILPDCMWARFRAMLHAAYGPIELRIIDNVPAVVFAGRNDPVMLDELFNRTVLAKILSLGCRRRWWSIEDALRSARKLHVVSDLEPWLFSHLKLLRDRNQDC